MFCMCISFSRWFVNRKLLLGCSCVMKFFLIELSVLLLDVCYQCMVIVVLLMMVLMFMWWCCVSCVLGMCQILCLLGVMWWQLGYVVSEWLFCCMKLSVYCYLLLCRFWQVYVWCIFCNSVLGMKLFLSVIVIRCWISILSGLCGEVWVFMWFDMVVVCVVVFFMSLRLWVGIIVM